jgi:hypothetical protein
VQVVGAAEPELRQPVRHAAGPVVVGRVVVQ